MTDIATPKYGRALLAVQARQMKETISEVMKSEPCQIMKHRLSEVCAECAWCEREYGEAER